MRQALQRTLLVAFMLGMGCLAVLTAMALALWALGEL